MAASRTGARPQAGRVDSMALSPQQLRAARELLGWTRVRLSALVGTSETSIAHYESGRRLPTTLDLLVARRVLEAAGVDFATDEEPGLGQRRAGEANEADRFLTMTEVAARIRKSKRWLQEFLRTRPLGKVIRRKRLFSEDDVAAIIDALTRAADAREVRGRRVSVPARTEA